MVSEETYLGGGGIYKYARKLTWWGPTVVCKETYLRGPTYLVSEEIDLRGPHIL